MAKRNEINFSVSQHKFYLISFGLPCGGEEEEGKGERGEDAGEE